MSGQYTRDNVDGFALFDSINRGPAYLPTTEKLHIAQSLNNTANGPLRSRTQASILKRITALLTQTIRVRRRRQWLAGWNVRTN